MNKNTKNQFYVNNDELQDPRARAQGENDSATKHSQNPGHTRSTKNKTTIPLEVGETQPKQIKGALY
jgi:hypothetical protein